MRYRFWKKIITACLLIFCTAATTLYAKTTQKEIDKTKKQLSNLENQKEEAEGNVDEIQRQKEELEGELGGLHAKMKEITASMNELENDIAEQENRIKTAEQNLKAAEERQRQQYEDMKIRIQYMYENSFSSEWENLLSAGTFADFLNRVSYILEMNQYDRRKLEEFIQNKEQITQEKKNLEEERNSLLARQQEMQQKQQSVDSLIADTKSSLSASSEKLSRAQSDVDELEAKIAKMQAYEKELEIKKAKEDAARLEAIKKQEQEDYSSVSYVPQQSDAYLLGAIIECEAGGEPYDGKLAVGSVIMNRVKSSYFPNTISGVIYQSGQFSPVASGRLAYRLKAGVDSTCLAVAQEVLNGKSVTGCLYFCVNNGYITGTVIGNHVFY